MSILSKNQKNNDPVNNNDSQNSETVNTAFLITESREWFRDQYRRMTMLSVVVSMVASMSLLLNIAQYIFRPAPKYFAQTPDLRITELVPLNEPYLTQQGVTDWTMAVVNKTLSLGFTDYIQKLNEVQPNFYEKAFREFVQSMKDAGTITLITQKKLIMNPAPSAAPIVAGKGINEKGVMSWKIEYPIMVSYESSQGTFLTQKLIANVLIERVSVLDNATGILIRQLILKPGK